MPSFFCHAPDDNLVRDSDYMHTLAPQRIREPAPRDHMQLESCSGWPRHGAGFYTDGYLIRGVVTCDYPPSAGCINVKMGVYVANNAGKWS